MDVLHESIRFLGNVDKVWHSSWRDLPKDINLDLLLLLHWKFAMLNMCYRVMFLKCVVIQMTIEFYTYIKKDEINKKFVPIALLSLKVLPLSEGNVYVVAI